MCVYCKQCMKTDIWQSEITLVFYIWVFRAVLLVYVIFGGRTGCCWPDALMVRRFGMRQTIFAKTWMSIVRQSICILSSCLYWFEPHFIMLIDPCNVIMIKDKTYMTRTVAHCYCVYTYTLITHDRRNMQIV